MVKVCGITGISDAKMVASAGVDVVGVIVDVPVATPRKISLEQAVEIRDTVKNAGKKLAVVLMPETLEEVVKVEETLSPDFIQLHGSENLNLLADIYDKTRAKIVKAFHVNAELDMEYVENASEYADMILLDTKIDGKVGGTGVTHDLAIDLKIKKMIPKPLILSGGLNPENAGETISTLTPYGVDVSSGVETSPGVKDQEKVEKFMEVVRCL